MDLAEPASSANSIHQYGKFTPRFQGPHCGGNLPCLIRGDILLSPLLVTDGRAIIGFPSPSRASAAPRIKSTWPPKPKLKGRI